MQQAPPASQIAARVRGLSESPTLAITAKAQALKAAGEDVIDFGVGEPDFPTPAHVVAAAERACADTRYHHYTPTGGLPALREAIAAKTARDSGLEVEPAEVLVANGGKHALYNVFQTLVDQGDEVLLPAPYWVTYPEQIRLAGGVVVPLPTTPDTGFQVTVEQLESALTPRTKMLVFVSPSNPTGAVYSPAEVTAIGRWAAEKGLWVVTDEIYEHLVYRGARHVSMPVVVPELRERCVVVNGVAKTYAMTGWRVGWSIAPAYLTRRMINLQSHLTSNVANVSQAAALAAVSGPLDAVEEMLETYERRRGITFALLNAAEGVSALMPEGAFYAFPSVEGALGRPIGDWKPETSAELCEALLDTARVALVPGEAFGAPGYCRLSFALSNLDLERGLERIGEALA